MLIIDVNTESFQRLVECEKMLSSMEVVSKKKHKDFEKVCSALVDAYNSYKIANTYASTVKPSAFEGMKRVPKELLTELYKGASVLKGIELSIDEFSVLLINHIDSSAQMCLILSDKFEALCRNIAELDETFAENFMCFQVNKANYLSVKQG